MVSCIDGADGSSVAEVKRKLNIDVPDLASDGCAGNFQYQMMNIPTKTSLVIWGYFTCSTIGAWFIIARTISCSPRQLTLNLLKGLQCQLSHLCGTQKLSINQALKVIIFAGCDCRVANIPFRIMLYFGWICLT